MSTTTGSWRVWLSEEARATITAVAAAAHPHETGGILVGVIGRSLGSPRPWVTHAVEVPSPKSGPTRYELPPRARESSVWRLRKTDPRLGYLGDWHSHPIDIGPSHTDTSSIAAISITGDCRRPLLFVVRRVNGWYDIDARQWTGAALRRLQICDAGSLASPLLVLPRRRRVPKLPTARGHRR